MWRYESPIGPMIIEMERGVGRYALIINGKLYGRYTSAMAAAHEVHIHMTGCMDWDRLDGSLRDVPSTIHEWVMEQSSVRSQQNTQ